MIVFNNKRKKKTKAQSNMENRETDKKEQRQTK